MKLNYFKPIDDLKADFAQLTLKGQVEELSSIMSHYSWCVDQDMQCSRVLTSQTKRVKMVYDVLLFEHEKRIDSLEQ